jgi:2-polyprenyl-3-methyl-5-hydroxy-6-metoxy-1,4-benzoquinol methylase
MLTQAPGFCEWRGEGGKAGKQVSVGIASGTEEKKMDADSIAKLNDGVFSKALQVRRLLQRGGADGVGRPLAEITLLARKIETLLSPEEMAGAAAGLAGQRRHTPTIEMNAAQGYAKWAESYDAEANPLMILEEPAVWEMIGEVEGKIALDAACGTGRYAIRLAQAGARVWGVDASEAMLAVARRKQLEAGVEVNFQRGDITRLPYPEAIFDVVVCALMLCHISDLATVFGELARLLKPEGRLIISDFHPFCLQVGWRTLFRRPEATYCIENHLHLTQDYLAALREAALTFEELREEVVDDRLLAILPEEEVERFRGIPGALIISARRKEQ